MRSDKLQLALESLTVDSFLPADPNEAEFEARSRVIRTVLDHTEAYSCGGTCGTCGGTDCYA